MKPQRLTALDTGFLRAEEPGVPMHVGAVSVFEGERLLDGAGRVRIDEIRRAIADRLHLVPRLRQVVREVPLGVGLPVWVDDVDFDIAAHVQVVTLDPPGGEEQLLRLTTGLHAALLDRSRPLWELWFVDGLAGGRVGLVEKVHHAMVDGVSGVDVATAILDLEPDPPAPAPAPPWRPERAPGAAALALEALADRVVTPGDVVRAVAGAVRAARPTAAAVVGLEEEGLFAPRLSLNGPVGWGRRLEAIRLPLEEVRAIGRAHDATVNDVVLAAVAGGLRQLLLARGERLDRDVKAFVPVSLRADHEHLELGNRVGGLFAPLPVGLPEPGVRLWVVSTWTKRAKRSSAPATLSGLLGAFDRLPPRIVGPVSRLIRHQPFVNLVVTNVPGPSFPVYLMGARMLETLPVVPLGANLTLGVGVLSYDGVLNLGVQGDTDACPDLDVFIDGLGESFAHLLGRRARPGTAVTRRR